MLGGLWKILLPVLKITAGGLVVGVSGLALVYVAGRNTTPVQAAKMAANPVKGVARTPGKVAGAARKARTGTAERRDAKFYKAAYKGTQEYKVGTAEARSTKVLPRKTIPGYSKRGGL